MLDSQVKVIRVEGKQRVQLLYDGVPLNVISVEKVKQLSSQGQGAVYRALWRDSERVVEKLRARNRGLREELAKQDKAP